MRHNGIAFFDMDGVLANCGHRLHYIDEGDYDSFYADENIWLDALFGTGLTLLEMFKAQGYKIVIVTSRRESCRAATLRWLDDALMTYFKSEDLYMRSNGDLRKSWEVKKDLLEKALQDNMKSYNSSGLNFFVDDYPKNCQMVAENFSDKIQPIIFGLGRINDDDNIQIQ